MVTFFAESTLPVEVTQTPPTRSRRSGRQADVDVANVALTSAVTIMSRGASRMIDPELTNAALIVRSLLPRRST